MKILRLCKIKRGVGIFHHQAICTVLYRTQSLLATSCGGHFSSLTQIYIFLEISEVIVIPKRKTARFELRMTPSERENLIAKANEAHLTVSQYIIRLSAEKKIATTETIPALIYEIRKIGVNINQIAHIGNSQRYLDNNLLNKVIADMENVKTLVQKILAEVYNADEHSIGTLEQRINELIERVDNIGNGQGN